MQLLSWPVCGSREVTELGCGQQAQCMEPNPVEWIPHTTQLSLGLGQSFFLASLCRIWVMSSFLWKALLFSFPGLGIIPSAPPVSLVFSIFLYCFLFLQTIKTSQGLILFLGIYFCILPFPNSAVEGTWASQSSLGSDLNCISYTSCDLRNVT